MMPLCCLAPVRVEAAGGELSVFQHLRLPQELYSIAVARSVALSSACKVCVHSWMIGLSPSWNLGLRSSTGCWLGFSKTFSLLAKMLRLCNTRDKSAEGLRRAMETQGRAAG